MKKEIEIIVKDGEQEYSCKVKRPDVATLSRVNKLSKADEVLAAQELLKGCWVSGDIEIQNDAYLLMAAVGKMGSLQEGVTAEYKKLIEAFTINSKAKEDAADEMMKMNALIRSNLGINPAGLLPMEYAEAYNEAIWLESFRLKNTAELLAAMFGGKKKKG